MDDSSDSIITIESKFLDQITEDPVIVINSIENELKNFVTHEIISETSPNVLIIERKGLNLFHPYIRNIGEMQGVSSIKKYQHSDIMRVINYSTIRKGNNNILLTDAITTGKEVEQIIHNFRLNKSFTRWGFSNKQGISKVCGYIAKESSLNLLREKYPHITFNFLKICNNDEEYRKEHNKLQFVYQNRMEPIDEEHPFVIISIEPKIELEPLKRLLFETIPDFYNSKYFINDNKLAIKTKKAFTIYLENPDEFLSRIDDDNYRNIEIEKMALRFKFSPEDSLLRIMALSMPHTASETKLEKIKHLLLGKCLRKGNFRLCHNLSTQMKRSHLFNSSACPHCIDLNISYKLLDSQLKSIKNSERFNDYTITRILT